MSRYDGPDDTLSYQLALTFDEYRGARKKYFAPEPILSALVELHDEFAYGLLAASSDLVSRLPDDDEEWRGEITRRWDDFLKDTHEGGFGEYLRESVEICIASDLLDRLPQSTDRCLELTRYVLDQRPGERVARYLARLGRCYIAGFWPECVMLCRAAIENAVEEAFQRRSVPLPATKAGASSMKTRLRAAHLLGWLSEDGLSAAETVWMRGNKAIHDDPQATSDVLGTIRLTNIALVELYAE